MENMDTIPLNNTRIACYGLVLIYIVCAGIFIDKTHLEYNSILVGITILTNSIYLLLLHIYQKKILQEWRVSIIGYLLYVQCVFTILGIIMYYKQNKITYGIFSSSILIMTLVFQILIGSVFSLYLSALKQLYTSDSPDYIQVWKK